MYSIFVPNISNDFGAKLRSLTKKIVDDNDGVTAVCNGFPDKMSQPRHRQHATGTVNGILRELSPNLPRTVTGTNARSTASTLTNSNSFDYDEYHKNNRRSILALAYMPADDNDNAPPRQPLGLRSEMEQQRDFEMEELADYEGDLDDEAAGADDVLVFEALLNNTERDEEAAVLANEQGHVSCNHTLTDEQLHTEQDQADAPLLIPGAPSGWKPPCAPEDWVIPPKRLNIGEPDVEWKEVDNPGG